MGKGGDNKKTSNVSTNTSSSTANNVTSVSSNKYKLKDLTTENLKEWAEAYGVPVSDDRVKLLESLVCHTYTHNIYMSKHILLFLH
jgi:hypothetical protein